MSDNLKTIRVLCCLVLSMICFSCVTGEGFETLLPCDDQGGSRVVNAEQWVLDIGGEVERVVEEVILKLYVTSSDRDGNIYGALYLQDHPTNPNVGFELKTELSDSYLFYPPGAVVYLNLQGLFVRTVKDGIQVGSRFENFGNLTLGRIPSLVTRKHLSVSCEPVIRIEPLQVEIAVLQDRYQYRCVQFSNLQFTPGDLCKTFAAEKETTIRELTQCDGGRIELVNSGYSRFYDLPLPGGKGTGSGILIYKGSDPQLVINQAGDLQLGEQRCEGVTYECDISGPVAEVSGQELMISEIADPANTISTLNGRYMELFNPGTSFVNISGWEIRRFTNANNAFTAGTVIVLPDVLLPPQGVFVIAANAEHFYQIYGFSANLEGGGSSGADSNGDDNMVLYDSSGQIRDVFGIPGEDGTGTAHDFQDGKAVRMIETRRANKVFDPAEWRVYNGHGDQGTTVGILNAPEDFDPGVHQ